MCDVAVDPGGRALGQILHKAGSRKYVMLTRVNDKLSRHAQSSQRLVHLLTAGDRDVKVLVTAQE
jgi:hypothetical protein